VLNKISKDIKRQAIDNLPLHLIEDIGQFEFEFEYETENYCFDVNVVVNIRSFNKSIDPTENDIDAVFESAFINEIIGVANKDLSKVRTELNKLLE
jgi:RNase adaptor protein for sRNA GlmZ degradation